MDITAQKRESKLNPLTGYSRNKVEIENYLTEISDQVFSLLY